MECVWLLLVVLVYMGTSSCILLSWSNKIVFFSVSVLVCVCVFACVSVCTCSGQPGHHNLCFPVSMER